ncbi:unnamed protein product, partial [Cladocopium goreaui]
LRTAKQRSDDFTEDMKINLTEMSLIAPNGPRSSHWELACKQLNAGERQQLEAAYVERLKPVYEQLGGDIEHPEAACVDFRLFVVVLIGLAKFQDKPKLTTMVGEKPEQEQARRRLTMAIRVLCPNDGKDEAQGKGKKKKVPNGRRLTEDELFIVILAMHLIFIENSHKLHELVRKKVDIMLSNAAADSEYGCQVLFHTRKSRTRSTGVRKGRGDVARLYVKGEKSKQKLAETILFQGSNTA